MIEHRMENYLVSDSTGNVVNLWYTNILQEMIDILSFTFNVGDITLLVYCHYNIGNWWVIEQDK